MHALWLFLPNQTVADEAALVAAGYGGLIDPEPDGTDPRLLFFTAAGGPIRGDDGNVKLTDGTIVTLSEPDSIPPLAPPTFAAEQQCWFTTKSPHDEEADAGAFGYWRDFAPTPDTLSRRQQFAGWPAGLGDSEEWLLPFLIHVPLLTTEGHDAPITEGDRLAHRLARELTCEMREGRVVSGESRLPGSRALVEYALLRNYRGNWQLWEALGLFNMPNDRLINAVCAVNGVLATAHRMDRGE